MFFLKFFDSDLGLHSLLKGTLSSLTCDKPLFFKFILKFFFTFLSLPLPLCFYSVFYFCLYNSTQSILTVPSPIKRRH